MTGNKIQGSILQEYKWMMVASKGYGHVGALLDFTHLTHLAEPPLETSIYSIYLVGKTLVSLVGKSFPPQKAQVKHSPA